MLTKDRMFSGKDLFRLLWPLIAEQLLAVFVGMVDVLMVSKAGEAAVSGVSLVDSINILIIQVLFGLTSGGTVVCARFIGRKDKKDASRAGAQMLLFTVLLSLAVTAVMLLGGRHLLRIIFGKTAADVMDNAVIYLMITVLSFPFLALYNSCVAVFRANKVTRLSLYVSLLMNAVNIAGNAFCIFVLKMGVAGVAIPTVLSRALAAGVMLFCLQSPKNELRIRSLKDFEPDFMIMKKICAIGIPSSIESGIFQFGKLTLQSLVSSLGTTSIAAFAVAFNLASFLYLPGSAMSAGLLTVVGQCCGAGEEKQAKDYAWLLVGINYVLLAFLCTAMYLGCRNIVGWYHLSPEAAELAEGLIRAHTWAMIIWPVAFLFPNYFRATGKAAFTMVIAISSMWIFRVGLAHVFIHVLHMNVLGVWYAMFIDWFFRVVVFAARYWLDNRKENR